MYKTFTGHANVHSLVNNWFVYVIFRAAQKIHETHKIISYHGYNEYRI